MGPAAAADDDDDAGTSAPPDLHLKAVALPSYANNSVNPVQRFAPGYAGAADVACKMVSCDRVAQQLGAAGHFPEKRPNVTCAALNALAAARALALLRAHWPPAVARWTRQGRPFAFQPDAATYAGPQWVFLSGLAFKATKTAVQVTSPRLYSSIASPIFPGNMYCKVLSPAKAIEWIQTDGLTERLK